jgi:hypothetical protein
MMGFAFDVPCEGCPCEGCEPVFEVVELLTASLNCFTWLAEAAPVFAGAGLVFLAVSVALGTLISCCLSKPVCVPVELIVPVALVVDCQAQRCD